MENKITKPKLNPFALYQRLIKMIAKPIFIRTRSSLLNVNTISEIQLKNGDFQEEKEVKVVLTNGNCIILDLDSPTYERILNNISIKE